MKIHNFQLTKVSFVMIDSRAFFFTEKSGRSAAIENGDFDAYRILVSVKSILGCMILGTMPFYKIIAFLKQFHNQIQDPVP